jgi:glycosyltransferase involved in cell wall biosynthesis
MEKKSMPLLLSIVIPTLNADKHLDVCLDALNQGHQAALDSTIDVPEIEVIIADGGSSDDTNAIAGRRRLRIISAPAGRGPQLAEGARSAKGEWLLFLHADTQLTVGWMTAVASFVNNPANRNVAAAFRFALDEDSPAGDQGLLIPSCLYDALGGYGDEPLMEDVALVSAIGRDRIRFFDIPAVTSAARYQKGGYILRPMLNLSCLGLYFLGLPTPLIARLYGR